MISTRAGVGCTRGNVVSTRSGVICPRAGMASTLTGGLSAGAGAVSTCAEVVCTPDDGVSSGVGGLGLVSAEVAAGYVGRFVRYVTCVER